MEKTIRTCDACEKVIPDKFYNIQIDQRAKGGVLEKIIIHGDLCQDCFNATITNLQRSIRK